MATALSSQLSEIEGVVQATALERDERRDRGDVDWERETLGGRLGELSGSGASASSSAALELILECQRKGEPTAWVSAGSSLYFPPDAERNGVDLAALPVVRVEGASTAARAADKLLRSGGFGLIVVDLVDADPPGPDESMPRALQKRLIQHADAHDAAVVVLTEKGPDAPSFGALSSFRLHTERQRKGSDRFEWRLEALADSRFGPGWRTREVYRGPPGLR